MAGSYDVEYRYDDEPTWHLWGQFFAYQTAMAEIKGQEEIRGKRKVVWRVRRGNELIYQTSVNPVDFDDLAGWRKRHIG